MTDKIKSVLAAAALAAKAFKDPNICFDSWEFKNPMRSLVKAVDALEEEERIENEH